MTPKVFTTLESKVRKKLVEPPPTIDRPVPGAVPSRGGSNQPTNQPTNQPAAHPLSHSAVLEALQPASHTALLSELNRVRAA